METKIIQEPKYKQCPKCKEQFLVKSKNEIIKKIGLFLIVLLIMCSIPFVMLFGVNKWITTCDNVHWDNSVQTIHSILPLKYLDIKLTCNSSDKSIMAFANVTRAVTFNLIK